MTDTDTDSEADSEQDVNRNSHGYVLPAEGRDGEVYPCINCGQYETVQSMSGYEYAYVCVICELQFLKRQSEATYNA